MHEHVELELDWPFTYVTTSNEGGGGFDAFRSGNPFLAGYYVHPLEPLGFWDFWLYSPERLGLVVPIQFELDRDGLLLGGELATAVLVPIDPQFAPETEVTFQLAPMIGARLGQVSLGTRVQLVWLATADSEDEAQLALVPFVQAKLGRSGFLHGRFVLPLDEPIGILGDGDFVWGLHLGGGASF